MSAPDSRGHGDGDVRSENQHLRRVMRVCVCEGGGMVVVVVAGEGVGG